MNKKIAIVCLGLSILVMYAAAYQAPPEQPPRRIVVRAGRLLDVKTYDLVGNLRVVDSPRDNHLILPRLTQK